MQEKRPRRVVLWFMLALAILALAALPALAAGGLGRLIGDLWVTTMGAIAALLGGG